LLTDTLAVNNSINIKQHDKEHAMHQRMALNCCCFVDAVTQLLLMEKLKLSDVQLQQICVFFGKHSWFPGLISSTICTSHWRRKAQHTAESAYVFLKMGMRTFRLQLDVSTLKSFNQECKIL